MTSKDLDELWEVTEGTPTCPKCGSPLLYGHIREIKNDLAIARALFELDAVCFAETFIAVY